MNKLINQPVNKPKETLINSANVMKREAHGTQQPRHINQIDEEASTAQRSDLPVQSINQRFPNILFRGFAIAYALFAYGVGSAALCWFFLASTGIAPYSLSDIKTDNLLWAPIYRFVGF